MRAKDLYHDCVKTALVKEGWTITHDPFTMSFGKKDVFIDLGAERPFAAEKDGQKIAVEIKVFGGPSEVRDVQNAVGQFVFYRSWLSRIEPDRRLYLAVTEDVFDMILSDLFARPVIDDVGVSLIIFQQHQERILRWIG